MELKRIYEQEITYLQKMLERSKKDISTNGLVQYQYNGLNREGTVSPRLEAYNKLLNMYLKTLKDYKELCKSMSEEK